MDDADAGREALADIADKLNRLITDAEGKTRPVKATTLGRQAATYADPLAFARLYLGHHLRRDDDPITLSEVHLAWAAEAATWLEPVTKPYESRTAEIGPREVGKSTWWYLILPMWAAAHGHVKFAAAFANTPTQAETHLASFKAELESNVLLRQDYPDLCAPKTRGRGTVAADRVSLYHARSGFVFAAAGMDSSSLGLKVGSRRPDLIIMDDIEPHEANYSADQATKRLATLRDAILPLNIYARVVIVGTVTMAGSIIHQLVKSAQGLAPAQGEGWILEENFKAHHYPAIVANDDGTRRSVWPAKWSLAFLESIEGTRTYAKNYANDPIGADGDYWTMSDFRRGTVAGITRRILFVDPAVTTKASSDYTGLALVSYSPSERRVLVEYAAQVKLGPDKLREFIVRLTDDRAIGGIVVEANQGGALWLKILWGLPVKTFTNSTKKEVRAAEVLNHYQRGRVVHVEGLTEAEGQMVAFPKAPHDDMVDAIGSGVAYYLNPKAKNLVTVETATYA